MDKGASLAVGQVAAPLPAGELARLTGFCLPASVWYVLAQLLSLHSG